MPLLKTPNILGIVGSLNAVKKFAGQRTAKNPLLVERRCNQRTIEATPIMKPITSQKALEI